jgi:hypothetical protein
MTLLARAADFAAASRSAGAGGVTLLDPLRPGAAIRPDALPAKAGFGWLALCGLLLAVVAARAFNGVPAPECRTTPVRLAFGTVVEASMITAAELPCPVSLRAGSARIDTLTVGAPPRHGAVTPRGRTGVTYHPLRGFRGDDAFSFSLHGRSHQNYGTAVVHVAVSVQ